MTEQSAIINQRGERQTALPLSMRLAGLVFGRTPAAWVVSIMRPFFRQLGVLLLLGLCAAGIGLVPPYLSKLLIDQGLMAGDINALMFWAAMLFVVGLCAVALGALNNILHMRASVRMLAELRERLLTALIRKPQPWFATQRAGELLARVDGDAGTVQQFAFNAVLGGLSNIVRLIGGTTMLMVLNWKLGLVAAALAPIELLFLAWARPRTTRIADDVRTARGQLTAGLSEMLHGLAMLQLAKGTDWARMRSLSDQAGLNDQLLGQQRWVEFTRAVPQILSATMRAGIFVAGGVMVIRGDWPLGSLIAFIAYMGFMIGPMQSLLGLWHAQARAKVALWRLDPLLSDAVQAPVSPTPQNYALTVEQVCLPHGDATVSFTLDPGSKLRLSGPSGSGKTSLLRLLAGYDHPRAGQVRIGTQPVIGPVPGIAFVSQRPFTVRGSVRDNLFLPADTAADPETEARIWELLDVADLRARFLSADGLDTILGENGLTLSGGERQRLCLIRALVHPFEILILDEALSEVDPATVQRLLSFIDHAFADKTRIITTHSSASAYGVFDRVVDLTKGGTDDHRLD